MDSKKRHQVDLHVGQRLRKRRQELGMSQEQLGEAVELTFQQIQKYEKGYNRISSSKLFEFSHILKTTVGYFFDGYKAFVDLPDNETYTFRNIEPSYASLDSADNNYEVNEVADTSLDLEIKEMIVHFRSIASKEARQHILNLAKLLSTINFQN